MRYIQAEQHYLGIKVHAS